MALDKRGIQNLDPSSLRLKGPTCSLCGHELDVSEQRMIDDKRICDACDVGREIEGHPLGGHRQWPSHGDPSS
jgi:hypothetical protein